MYFWNNKDMKRFKLTLNPAFNKIIREMQIGCITYQTIAFPYIIFVHLGLEI